MKRPDKPLQLPLRGVGATPAPVQMPGGGPISFSQLRAELGADGPISISTGRGLAEVPEGPLSMSNFFGKSTYVPPVENIEWRYNSTADTLDDAVDHFQNADGVTNTIINFVWDQVSVFGDDANALPVFPTASDPTGMRVTAPDGRIFQVGSYRTTYTLMGSPFYNEYEIGLVTYT